MTGAARFQNSLYPYLYKHLYCLSLKQGNALGTGTLEPEMFVNGYHEPIWPQQKSGWAIYLTLLCL